MVALVAHLRQRGYRIFDAQLMNPHLARFGAYQIDDADYSRLLAEAIALPCCFLPGPEDR
jgi:leucyl/phenylalanyl-tRNA--protein transferase